MDPVNQVDVSGKFAFMLALIPAITFSMKTIVMNLAAIVVGSAVGYTAWHVGKSARSNAQAKATPKAARPVRRQAGYRPVSAGGIVL